MAVACCDLLNGVNYTGQTNWVVTTVYVIGNRRIGKAAGAYVKVVYDCILGHTSAAADEPGVGANWATYWVVKADGQAATPYLTGADAGVVAGTNGEVRWAGQQLTTIGVTGLFTEGSTSAVFVGDVTAIITAGCFLHIPALQALELPSCYRVTSSAFAGGNTTVTLTHTFRDATASYTAYVVPTYAVAAVITLATSCTHTFGWKLDDQTQPTDYVTAIAHSITKVITVSASLVLVANGRLKFLIDAAGYSAVGGSTDNLSIEIRGLLEFVGCGGTTVGAIVFTGLNRLVVDVLVGTGGQTCLYGSGYIGCVGRRLVSYNSGFGAVNVATSTGFAYFDYVEENGCACVSRWSYGRVRIGRLKVRNLTNTGNGPAGLSNGQLRIDDYDVNQTITLSLGVYIGSPATKWTLKDLNGLWDLVTGRGGSGNSYRIDPTSQLVPTVGGPCGFKTVVDAGKAITLKFYSYASGTTVPTACGFVDLITPNGLTCERKTFTPVAGASWTDATQQSITFTGVTSYNGPLEVIFGFYDNPAGDLVAYLDDISWVQA